MTRLCFELLIRLGLFTILLLWLAASGCSPSLMTVQAKAADAAADAANQALPELVDYYKQEGLDIVDGAATEQEARAGLAKFDEKWEKVWLAWRVFRAAQSAWVDTLEQGKDSSAVLSTIKVSLCMLNSVWPQGLDAIPLPVPACEKGPP